MGRFYNAGRTPTAATTKSGHALCFSPRAWQYIPLGEESTSSIRTLVKKGILIRQDDERDYVVPTEETVAPVAPAALAPVHTPPVVSPPEVEVPVISEVASEEAISKKGEEAVANDAPSGTDSSTRDHRSSRRK